MVNKFVSYIRRDEWLFKAGARSLGIDHDSPTNFDLNDVVTDNDRSEAERDRATMFLLLEDSLVNGVELAAKGLLNCFLKSN